MFHFSNSQVQILNTVKQKFCRWEYLLTRYDEVLPDEFSMNNEVNKWEKSITYMVRSLYVPGKHKSIICRITEAMRKLASYKMNV